MNIRRLLTTVILAVLSIGHAVASDPVLTIIVPFAAGGGGDLATRTLQNRLSQELKQPVVIQNIAGASGVVGTVAIKKANNDGTVIGLSLGSTIGTGQLFNKEMPYDYATDFEFVGMLGEIPRGLFVSSQSKYQTINDVVADNQVSRNFGLGGNSPEHVNAVIFNSLTNSNHQLVPYTVNTNTMIMDLLGSRLDGVWQSLPAMNSCLQNHSCRLLAITGNTRYSNHSGVPTFKEIGLGKINAPSYYGFIAPKGVAKQRLEQLNRAINVALRDPDIVKKLQDSGITASPQDLATSKHMHFSAVDIAKQAEPLIFQGKK